MIINIKASLKSKEETHIYEGRAIKNKNIITYKDETIFTKIIIDDNITIERKGDYKLLLNIKKGIKLKGNYITKYGSFNIETYTKSIIKKENSLKIIYDLIVDGEYIDTFTYYCEYSIDS